MFGLFDGVQNSMENVIDVGLSIGTMGIYGDISKSKIAKLIADGVEIAIIAQGFGVAEDVIEKLLED